MNVEMETRGNNLMVRLKGELDHHAAESFRSRIQKELEKGRARNLVLNMSGLSFMDSSGIGVILGRYNFIKKTGGKIAVCNLKPQVRKVFHTAGLSSIIKEYGSEEEAAEKL